MYYCFLFFFLIYKAIRCCKRSITVWTAVQTVLTATFNSLGDRQISTPPPHKISTLNRSTKNRHIDCVHKRTPYTQFGTNPSTQSYWANGRNNDFFHLYLFFSGSRTGQTPGWMFTRDSSKDVKSRKEVPFRGLNDVPLNFVGKTPQKLNYL